MHHDYYTKYIVSKVKSVADLFIETIYSKLKEIIERESINVSCACHQYDKEGNKAVTSF